MSGGRRFALLLLIVAAKLAGCAGMGTIKPVPPYAGAACMLDGKTPVNVRASASGAIVRSGWWVVEPMDGRGWWIVADSQLSGCL